ncbi:hypothetical protein PHYSODRAFT_333449 [Phytophthora sojae]|uniref:MSP domain-containing protein n=1 Tax=Phytophthora sojae (strain P6497) TaxID=1094619 RepID=G4ZQE1_PHYSP|nr:hypothetical protein PHYSODRAFT_333449 [Phytophthora sojae]EGZ15176.1 hypothetical protein PHYSODRAFT_333449 [Phytophthora sojae]|eukprot:XP_009528925.1 hypothetical protein PHYSODRAFT_333449 [Phytophthora sojae]
MPFRSYATSLILLNNPLASSPLTTQYAAHLPSLRLFKLVIYKLGPAKSNTGIGLATICRVAEATQPSFMELHYEGRAQGAPLEFSPKHRQHTLVLRNSSISSTAVLFKVQCTAPRRFRVRPALGLLIASGDTVNIQVQLRSQECTPASCMLLVVGRSVVDAPFTRAPSDAEQLKAMWAAAEASDSLVISEMINIRIQVSSVVTADHDKAMALPVQRTTTQVAELVLLMMKSQSSRQENALTDSEREMLLTARASHPSDWPCWEEYAARMRKLLRERNKRKAR